MCWPTLGQGGDAADEARASLARAIELAAAAGQWDVVRGLAGLFARLDAFTAKSRGFGYSE